MEPVDPELERTFQEMRATHRAEQEELAEAVEQAERAARSMADVALELQYRGDTVRLTVGQQSWTGVMIHAGAAVMTVVTNSGSEIDIAYDGLTSIRVVRRSPSGGRPGTSKHPGSLIARLRELENSGETVEIGGASMSPGLRGTIAVVAQSHIEVRGTDNSEWIIPLSGVGYVVRTPVGPSA